MSGRAIIYVRVSTDEQAKFGYSLRTQLDGCRSYAKERDFLIVDELADDCTGAIPMKDRPEGAKIYERVDAGGTDAVILFTQDRTARDELVLEYLLFKAYLYENNVQLHYADTGLDPFTMEANLIGYIKAHAASAERKKITERSTRGRNAKAESGKWVGAGPAPYGYRKVGMKRDARLEIDEAEAEVVQRIFREYIGGKGAGKIAADLTIEGVPFPSRNDKQRASSWYKSSLIKMLKNRCYLGDIRWKNTVRHFPELAIVDEETFLAAQEMRAKNRVQSKRNSKHEYVLSGFIFCHCGRRMSGRTVHARPTPYYNCNRYNNAKHQATCVPRWLRGDITDRIVWDWLQELLTNEEKLNAGLEEMNRQSKENKAGEQARYLEVKNLIDGVERRIKRLIVTVGQIDDDTVAEEMGAQVRMLSQQKEAWMKERKRLEEQLSQGEMSSEVMQWIRLKAAEIRLKLSNPTFEEKRELLKNLDLTAKLRWDENGRLWVDVSCGLKVADSLPLIHPSSSDNQNITPAGKIKRVIEKPACSSRRSSVMRRASFCSTTIPPATLRPARKTWRSPVLWYRPGSCSTSSCSITWSLVRAAG